jgi:PAS domain S-box-containing protein
VCEVGSPFLHTLYILSGICIYAGAHHALIARRQPIDRTHLWFALMCSAIALYVIAKAGAYQSGSAAMLVSQRRWELSFAVMLFMFFPWFVREYTGRRTPWLPAGFTLLMAAVLMANLLLPYGVGYMRLPDFSVLNLPWGERVADLRVPRQQQSAWFHVGLLGMILVLIYGLHASWRQYRHGERRRALTLAIAIAVFLALVLFNQLVNHGIVDFIHTAEFGFLALLLVMNQSLAYDERKFEQRMQAVLDNMPAVVYLKDLHGRYLLVNRQFRETFNFGNPAVKGKTDYDFLPKEQADTLRANDRRVMHECSALKFDESIEVGGVLRHYITCKFPILAPDGSLTAVGGTSMDVTDARRLEVERDSLREQVLHADRVARISTLSTSLAHELSQPLTAMLSNAQAGLRFLERGAPEVDEFRDILQDIVRDDERAIAIISGLRAMLRQKNTARERVDLANVVIESLDLVHDEILRRGARCERELQTNCYILADNVQIQQVILNLVMNALDALDPRPTEQRRLWVAVSSDGGGQARVVVRDSGAGLPSNGAERIFESFYSTKGHGLGMGLALCRSIIESHGGRIWANDNSDQGATVQFILPLVSEEKKP